MTVCTSELSESFLEDIIIQLANEFDNSYLRKKDSQLLAFKHKDYMITYFDGIGFSLWWDFQEFIFIEYVVVFERYRKHGYGSLLLKTIKDHRKLVILELETDCDIENFYLKNGFHLCNIIYSPIQINQKPQERLSLMSFDHELTKTEFLSFIKKITSDDLQF